MNQTSMPLTQNAAVVVYATDKFALPSVAAQVLLPPDIAGKANAEKVQMVMAAAGAVLAHAERLDIDDEDGYKAAAHLVQQVNTAIEDVETEQATLLAPVEQQKKNLSDWFRPSVTKLKETKAIIRRKMGDWADERSRREEQERQKAAADRRRNEAALQEIQAIQHQVLIADTGRKPYCEGRTVKGVDWLITETEKWAITEEKFGALYQSALNAKSATLVTLRAKRVEFEQSEIVAASAQAAQAATDEDERKAAQEIGRKAEMARMRSENKRLLAEAENDETLTQQIAIATATPAAPEPAARAKVAGIAEKKEWHHEILDESKIPAMFRVIDHKALAAFVRKNGEMAKPVLGDSCRVWSTTSVATGKK